MGQPWLRMSVNECGEPGGSPRSPKRRGTRGKQDFPRSTTSRRRVALMDGWPGALPRRASRRRPSPVRARSTTRPHTRPSRAPAASSLRTGPPCPDGERGEHDEPQQALPRVRRFRPAPPLPWLVRLDPLEAGSEVVATRPAVGWAGHRRDRPSSSRARRGRPPRARPRPGSPPAVRSGARTRSRRRRAPRARASPRQRRPPPASRRAREPSARRRRLARPARELDELGQRPTRRGGVHRRPTLPAFSVRRAVGERPCRPGAVQAPAFHASPSSATVRLSNGTNPGRPGPSLPRGGHAIVPRGGPRARPPRSPTRRAGATIVHMRAAVDILELAEQPRTPSSGPARGLGTQGAHQGDDLDSRVLAGDPGVAIGVERARAGLDQRVGETCSRPRRLVGGDEGDLHSGSPCRSSSLFRSGREDEPHARGAARLVLRHGESAIPPDAGRGAGRAARARMGRAPAPAPRRARPRRS